MRERERRWDPVNGWKKCPNTLDVGPTLPPININIYYRLTEAFRRRLTGLTFSLTVSHFYYYYFFNIKYERINIFFLIRESIVLNRNSTFSQFLISSPLFKMLDLQNCILIFFTIKIFLSFLITVFLCRDINKYWNRNVENIYCNYKLKYNIISFTIIRRLKSSAEMRWSLHGCTLNHILLVVKYICVHDSWEVWIWKKKNKLFLIKVVSSLNKCYKIQFYKEIYKKRNDDMKIFLSNYR